MKKALPLIIVLVVLVLIGGCSYNGMNSARINYQKSWADVQSAYQRRADLIPNLVATVKGAAEFEKSTYVQVAQARAGTLKSLTNVPADSLTPQRIAAIQQANTDAQSAMRMAINVAVERYPELKATENFTALQSQLEGTENRINLARNNYNEVVTTYNQKVTSFPNNIMAKLFSFPEQKMFSADQGAQNAPKVQF